MTAGTAGSLARVVELLSLCGTSGSVMPATSLYNEGWMLRLVLDWFSRQPLSQHPLSFLPGSKWYSEARLSTQFRRRRAQLGNAQPGNQFAESWTHADGVVGNFESFETRGDVRLTPHAKQFVVVEAKMFSGLSPGTKRAPTFDQASRNVACMAETLSGRPLDSLSPRFIITAPEAMIEKWRLRTRITSQTITDAVAARIGLYAEHPAEHDTKKAWFDGTFLPTLSKLTLSIVSWESVIAHIGLTDPERSSRLDEFFQLCIRFNEPKANANGAAAQTPDADDGETSSSM